MPVAADTKHKTGKRALPVKGKGTEDKAGAKTAELIDMANNTTEGTKSKDQGQMKLHESILRHHQSMAARKGEGKAMVKHKIALMRERDREDLDP